jgi:predicted O-methyltransferase YrrM
MNVLTHFLCWKLGLAQAETQTSPAERECLARHACGKRRLAEIGVWHGVNTLRLRAEMASEGVFFAIDPFPVGRLGFSLQRIIAYREVSRCDNGQVVWVRKTAVDAAKIPEISDQSMDFVFVDGDHSYDGLRRDWSAWSGLVAARGIVALHDSQSTSARNIDDAGSVLFTHNVILRDSRFELVETVDTLTVLRRCA